MELQYLQKLKDNPKIFEESIEGISEQEIKEYEEKLGITFPASYREFLYLAGDYPGDLTLLEGESGIRELTSPDFITFFEADKKLGGVSIERPYWAFSTGTDGFLYFYLDENSQDPKVWICQWGFGEVEIEQYDNFTFSEYINSVIDHSKKYYKGLYG
ncbi:SMI1/KNR4 family protein [Tenacibaculum discolor]|uniref:SMI1/KNR4 family protein n=1 Tax=Tenacibaculum discolor TaxID=361581 RepID=UPI000F59D065|nr:SMI1/KNR4 family protein [Tenacibaculum discolor]